MTNTRILVVEDNRKTASTIELYLRHAGFDVDVVYDGRDGLAKAREAIHDLLVLDLMLPHLDGFEVCRTLRLESRVPILVLTARSTEADKLQGLELGADDYVTKPFSPRELVARVRAILRRTQESGPASGGACSVLRFQNLSIDPARHDVFVGAKPVKLTPTEFRLLEVLMRAPERVFTRRELVDQALGWDYEGLERTVDAHIMNLRRKISAGGSQGLVTTVFGIGYKLSGTPDET